MRNFFRRISIPENTLPEFRLLSEEVKKNIKEMSSMAGVMEHRIFNLNAYLFNGGVATLDDLHQPRAVLLNELFTMKADLTVLYGILDRYSNSEAAYALHAYDQNLDSIAQKREVEHNRQLDKAVMEINNHLEGENGDGTNKVAEPSINSLVFGQKPEKRNTRLHK